MSEKLADQFTGTIAGEEGVPALFCAFLGWSLMVAVALVCLGLICLRSSKYNLTGRRLRLGSWTWRLERIRFLQCFGARTPQLGIAFALGLLCSILKRILYQFNCGRGVLSNPNNIRNYPEKPENEICDPSVSRPILSDSRSEVPVLNEADLKEFMSYLSESNGGPPWRLIMERSNPNLTYQAWYRDQVAGPPQYRTRTIFKNMSTELLRDFFWDDEFRLKWDRMLIHTRTLHVCPQTGTMVVHWIRKLPIVNIERECIIVRRIWEHKSSYYCISKGTDHPSLPRRRNPKRVELYYSSWYINPVKINDQQCTGSEVIFFHSEDIGIPKEIVKMAARAGMWNQLKKLDSAVQRYNLARANGAPRSAFAILACMTTKFELSEVSVAHTEAKDEKWGHEGKPKEGNAVRWLLVGGLLIASGLALRASSKVERFEVGKMAKHASTAENDNEQAEARTKTEPAANPISQLRRLVKLTRT